MSDPSLILSLAGIAIVLLLVCYRHRAMTRHYDYRVRTVGKTSDDRNWLWDSLTSREMEVAQLVALGRSNPRIAKELNITVNTVESHLKNIYRKLSVHSRVELVRAIRDLID